MTVAATVVVEFGQGVDTSALVVVELDGEANKDAEGAEKTSFAPGDTPYFLVHHDATVRVGQVACSSGSLTGGLVVTRSRTQQVQFTESGGSQELPHIPAGAVSWKWYGNQPAPSLDGRSLKVGSVGIPAIGDATYPISARQYRLVPPALTLAEDETYPILIVITMEAAL